MAKRRRNPFVNVDKLSIIRTLTVKGDLSLLLMMLSANLLSQRLRKEHRDRIQVKDQTEFKELGSRFTDQRSKIRDKPLFVEWLQTDPPLHFFALLLA